MFIVWNILSLYYINTQIDKKKEENITNNNLRENL